MKVIRLSDYGILPNTDITLALYELMKKHPRDTEFLFENADYYFSPKEQMRADYRISNSDFVPFRVLGMWLQHHENCVVNGGGARLYFEGQMQPITLDRCKNITVKNFTIDWKKPLVAEGVVREVGEKYADVYVNGVTFPHKCEESNLYFDVGAGEWYPLIKISSIMFDENNNSVTRGTGDRFTPDGVVPLGDNVYRISSHTTEGLKPGTTLVMRHNARIHAGIFSEKCEDLTVTDITVHSCGGLGCLAQFCHNLAYERIYFLPNRAAGRLISSGRDDGFHLTSNSGHITVRECSFLGLMDDPINVHSCCVTALEAADEKNLRCRFMHKQAKGFLYWAEKGDELSFIERKSMSEIHKAKVEEYELISDEEFTVRFAHALPEKIITMANSGDLLALDNLTHTASFSCEQNRFGSCRARGLLVSTPKKVKISENYFCSSGSAILVAGDSNYWFESGECHDVEISHNIFTENCLSSMYQFCEGIISVCPVVPEPQLDKPFHKNIKIFGNTFDTPATPVLYAFSVENLEFTDNTVFISPSGEKWHPGENWFRLSYCRDSDLSGNRFIGECSGLLPRLESVRLDNCENIKL